MAVRISAQGEAGMVARPGSLRKTATETAAEAEASGFFSAAAGRRPASMLALKRGQVRRRGLGGGRARSRVLRGGFGA